MRSAEGRGRHGVGKREMSRDELRRTLTGPITDEKRREVADRVSEPVKRAIDQAIKQNKPALRELGDQ